jgi:hypothetical protein
MNGNGMVSSGHAGGNEALGSSGAMVIDHKPAIKEAAPSFAPTNLNNDLIASEKEFERTDHCV